MKRYVLGFDLETGAPFDVTPEKNWITELGAVLWDMTTKTPVKIYNTLVKTDGKEVSEEAVRYTGITTEQCNKWGLPLEVVVQEFNTLLESADYIVAHNGRNFDIPVISNVYNTIGMEPLLLETTTLIDTMTDIPYPANCVNRNLTYLAGFHLVLNSFPHRAVSDVLTMLTVMSKYDWEETQAIANSPVCKYIAKFDYPTERKWGGQFKQKMEEFNKIKDGVKNLGFKWKPDTKQWVLETREYMTKDMEFPCPVTIIKD